MRLGVCREGVERPIHWTVLASFTSACLFALARILRGWKRADPRWQPMFYAGVHLISTKLKPLTSCIRAHKAGMDRSMRLHNLLSSSKWNDQFTMASSREATNNSSRSVRTTRPSLASGMQDLTLASPDHAPQGWYSDSEDDEKIINKDRMKKPSGKLPSQVSAMSMLTMAECVKVSEPHIYTLSFAEQIGVEESFCNLTSLKQYPFDHLGACFRKQVCSSSFSHRM